MATLEYLKRALRDAAKDVTSTLTLSQAEYSAGFEILLRESGWMNYQEFIVPELCRVLASLPDHNNDISVLEVGPGPESVIGYLPANLRSKIKKYTAFEPNQLFAARLKAWLISPTEKEFRFPGLSDSPNIRQIPFELVKSCIETSVGSKYDLVVFCHSLYGLKPAFKLVRCALDILADDGMVAVFHGNARLDFGELVAHQTASFPMGITSVADDYQILNAFASFIAGYTIQGGNGIQAEWRRLCRELGGSALNYPGRLVFSSPDIMVTFTRNATSLSDLTSKVPVSSGSFEVKNREARLYQPAAILQPTEIKHVQETVRWALKNKASLTVIGGGHSGHCIWPNVVALDMGAFKHLQIATEDEKYGSLVFAEAGCKAGDIVQKCESAGLAVPMGSRPSVGSGLWLHGGIGHQSRLHGLTCDAIVGAVIVSVASGDILCVGHVPSQFIPVNAVFPENADEILWAVKGAGTNVGIVVGVVFRGFPASKYSIWKSVTTLNSTSDLHSQLIGVNQYITNTQSQSTSLDLYLYSEEGQLSFGMTMFQSEAININPITLGLPGNWTLTIGNVDGVGLFEADMYISMHGGHAGGKTSSFKRCLFLHDIGSFVLTDFLTAAMKTRPSPNCYFHLLQGGGAIKDGSNETSTFGYRDWDYACVITGVWPRDKDNSQVSRQVIDWVYRVTADLLPLSVGVYSADLGPDPRDSFLVTKVFGRNRQRLAHLKQSLDPQNILAYVFPIHKLPISQKLLFIITGVSGAGKDYCTAIWADLLANLGIRHGTHRFIVRTVSISDTTKREYAIDTGANLKKLLTDRAYKEQHRSALTAYFKEQVHRDPDLPEEHFIELVSRASGVDVLLVTGMRDEAPVATLSHLVPGYKLIEINIRASRERSTNTIDDSSVINGRNETHETNGVKISPHHPCLVFYNDRIGVEGPKQFFDKQLSMFVNKDIERLTEMVPIVPNFPDPCIGFRHVLNIAQTPGGLALCTSMLRDRLLDNWGKVDSIVSCESGGFVFASALAANLNLPLVLIRQAGKLPPPTISSTGHPSHILAARCSILRTLEMSRDVLSRGSSVVVVDDVLASGQTLCTVLELLIKAGVDVEDISVLVVAEFPTHRGRQAIYKASFGRVRIHSLLVFSGM